ncbi:MAG: EscU/YscU/HrcU family type III secretion system export apparatus switch protein [Planctomycetota bacterium]
MAGAQDKTEPATPTKLRKAREKGEVAVSQEVSAAAVMGAALLVLVWTAAGMLEQLRGLTTATLTVATRPIPKEAAVGVLWDAVGAMLLMLIPLLLALSVAAAAAVFFQIGALLTFKTMQPKLEKLNPLSGVKKIFASKKTYVELVKSTLKVVVVGLLAWNVIGGELGAIVALPRGGPEAAAALTADLTRRIAGHTLIFVLFLAALDFLYQKWDFAQNQKMTKEEVKREFKDQEGDPQHKAQRQRLHEEINTNLMLEQVRKADVIVVNPTHLACALRYDPDEESAPRLVAKGAGHLAARIREIAKEEDIPILRDVSLARALHSLQLDEQIDEDLYDAVAEVLRWVEQVAASRGQLPGWIQPPPAPPP